MYYKDDRDQLGIDDFFLPFGGKLKKDNRWVRMAEIMPWDYIEEVYLESMSQETGRSAFPARIAYGAIYVKEQEDLTDDETVEAIAENPYIQYFLGLKEFRDEPLFNASMMVHFRKRFPVEALAKINEYICTGKRPEDEEYNDSNEPPMSGGAAGKPNKNTSKKKLKKQKKNRGKLLMDATVAPADIKYPTDIDLLNKSREHLETAVDILWNEVPHKGHKLPYSAKKARKSYLALSKSKRWTKAKCRKAISEQLRYIELAMAQLKKCEEQVPVHDELYPRWLKDRLSIIPVVYAQQEMHTLSADQLAAFLHEARESGVYEMYYFELATGLRRGELLGLKWEDVDWERRTVRICRQVARINGEVVEAPLKTKNSYRTISLGGGAMKVLEEQEKKTGDAYVFPSPNGGPISPDSVQNMLNRVLKRAGLPKIRVHDLRHTFATLALQNGVDIKTVSGMLGHYSAGFTLDTYTHVTTPAQIEAANTMGNVLAVE